MLKAQKWRYNKNIVYERNLLLQQTEHQQSRQLPIHVCQLPMHGIIYYPTVGQDIKKIFVPTHRAGLPDPRRGEGSPAVGRDEYFFDILSYCGIIDLSHTYFLLLFMKKHFKFANFIYPEVAMIFHSLSNESHFLAQFFIAK